MINVRTIRKMVDGSIIHLKDGNVKRYKSGFELLECPNLIFNSADDVMTALRDYGEGNFEIQYLYDKYWMSRTIHVYNKCEARKALDDSRDYQRIIYNWQAMTHQAV